MLNYKKKHIEIQMLEWFKSKFDVFIEILTYIIKQKKK